MDENCCRTRNTSNFFKTPYWAWITDHIWDQDSDYIDKLEHQFLSMFLMNNNLFYMWTVLYFAHHKKKKKKKHYQRRKRNITNQCLRILWIICFIFVLSLTLRLSLVFETVNSYLSVLSKLKENKWITSGNQMSLILGPSSCWARWSLSWSEVAKWQIRLDCAAGSPAEYL